MRQPNEEIDVTFTIYAGLLPGTALLFLEKQSHTFSEYTFLYFGWFGSEIRLGFLLG